MHDYPEHRRICQTIIAFASEGQADLRAAIARIDEWMLRRPERDGTM